MEPCAHHGRTPPCVDAIVAAGIARVVAGCRDPNPEAAGGLERLRAGGDRGRARRPLRGAAPERGLAHLEGARPPVRHLQGGDHARRPGHRAGQRAGSPARPRGASSTSSGPRRTRSPSGWEPCGPTHRASTRATSPSCGSRAGSPSAAGRCRRTRSSSCAPATLARRARRARRRGRAVAPPRRRADARDGLPRGEISSTSCSSSSRRRSRAAGPRFLGDLSLAEAAAPPLRPAGRRRRAARGLPARALGRRPRGSLSACSPGSCARSERSSPSPGGDEGVRLEIEAPVVGAARRGRRLGRDQRRLPHGRDGRRRRASPSTPFPRRSPARRSARSRAGAARQPRAGPPRRRRDGRAHRPGPRRRRRHGAVGRRRRARGCA